ADSVDCARTVGAEDGWQRPLGQATRDEHVEVVEGHVAEADADLARARQCLWPLANLQRRRSVEADKFQGAHTPRVVGASHRASVIGCYAHPMTESSELRPASANATSLEVRLAELAGLTDALIRETLERGISPVAQRLEAVLEYQLGWRGPDLRPLASPVTGGKKVRPALVLLACEAVCGEIRPAAQSAAV